MCAARQEGVESAIPPRRLWTNNSFNSTQLRQPATALLGATAKIRFPDGHIGRARRGHQLFTFTVVAFQEPMTRWFNNAPTIVRIWMVILNSTFMIPLRASVAWRPTQPPALLMGRHLGARTTCIQYRRRLPLSP